MGGRKLEIPKSREYDSYFRQLLRSSSSVASNYRRTLKGKSDKDFLNKLRIVEEETDEKQQQIFRPLKEGEELLKIVVASTNTTKKKMLIYIISDVQFQNSDLSCV